ncbi:hypothetical protein [cf. Phormidesmis sp. LEGE 11477]|uniref:hypothetical protein n=1 Tax=cf. Phormidesmis sp. LEGE 11477 TaxID=1828680 RepID=UPI001881378D|nr:hypothetical protein [cf. Phormidesmis sp. LEGE 11477]MBE9064849.1 hypothetical protein [cf. Phormidesmis sp. LEGE 11477]
MQSPATAKQNGIKRAAKKGSSDPLPKDLKGQHLCEIFGSYLYCTIYADMPADTREKPEWHTQRRYKLKSRVLYRDWQDAEKLIGVRPGHTIAYALLDIDINSPYHPKQDANAIARIEAALETIGITRTIRIRSSWSEGIHLYLPLPEPVKTFDLAVSLKNCLEPQGFKFKAGHLECFPNVKAYGNTIKIEYLAHRLPLQPASGSCLLDEAFNPSSNKLKDFLQRWDIAATGQDIITLKQALPLARKNRFKRIRRRLNKIDSWKQDLETVLAEGWTGHGQTNQLLKEIGCYGHVFLGHSQEELVDFIYRQAISSPGYGKWCRHQHEIRLRSRVWATAVEQYYWPIGTYDTKHRDHKEAANNIAPFNSVRAQNARESIKAAVQHLEATGSLPDKATERSYAVRQAQSELGRSSSSLETLYKVENKKLWHPDLYSGYCSEGKPIKPPVIDETNSLSETKAVTTGKSVEHLKPSEIKGLRTEEEIMKCTGCVDEVFSLSKTKFYSGKGGAGGIKSFPQEKSNTVALFRESADMADAVKPTSHAQAVDLTASKSPTIKPAPVLRSSKKTTLEKGISKTVSQTIKAIQTTVQKLGWPIEKINLFISQKFKGKRRAQLSDEELVELLYHLRVQCLECKKLEAS